MTAEPTPTPEEEAGPLKASRPLEPSRPPESDDDFWDLEADAKAADGWVEASFFKADSQTESVHDAGSSLGKPLANVPRVIKPAEHVTSSEPPEATVASRRQVSPLNEVRDEFADLEGPDFGSFVDVPPAVVEPAGVLDEVVAPLAKASPSELVSADLSRGNESAVEDSAGGGFLADPDQVSHVVPLRLPRTFGEWVTCLSGRSVLEKACSLMVVLLLTGFAAIVFFPAILDLPEEKVRSEADDFPMQGAQVKVLSAETYWREPVKEGANADVYRRDSVLLPALDLKLSGGPAALRVLFRSEGGSVVGDAVTREVSGDGVLKIVGTTGFGQYGMYASYRAGREQPWVVQVYEASSVNAASDDFVLLFEMEMSTELR